MPDQEYIFRQAKRIYDDCVSSQEQGSQAMDGNALASSYNDLLNRAQESFPDNTVIQSLEEVEQTTRVQRKQESVQRVRSRTSKLADALGINLSDLKDSKGSRELQPIEVSVNQDVDQSQEQDQSQQQQQYVDVDQVLEEVDRAAMPPDEKEELKEIVREFHEELEGEQDESRLTQLLGRAEEYSVEVVAKLGILGLQYGVTDLVV